MIVEPKFETIDNNYSPYKKWRIIFAVLIAMAYIYYRKELLSILVNNMPSIENREFVLDLALVLLVMYVISFGHGIKNYPSVPVLWSKNIKNNNKNNSN